MRIAARKVGLFLFCLQLFGCNSQMDIYTLCRVGDVKNLSRILDSQPQLINTQDDKQKWTPLHYSIYFGRIDVARLLLARGADVNLVTKGGETPLHFAASELNAEMVRLLLDAGADVTVKTGTPNHDTPWDNAVIAKKHVAESRLIPPASIKNYKPKTKEELEAEDAQINTVLELLKNATKAGIEGAPIKE